MKFKELEWQDIISDGVVISSTCNVKVNGKVLSLFCRSGQYQKIKAGCV